MPLSSCTEDLVVEELMDYYTMIIAEEEHEAAQEALALVVQPFEFPSTVLCGASSANLNDMLVFQDGAEDVTMVDEQRQQDLNLVIDADVDEEEKERLIMEALTDQLRVEADNEDACRGSHISALLPVKKGKARKRQYSGEDVGEGDERQTVATERETAQQAAANASGYKIRWIKSFTYKQLLAPLGMCLRPSSNALLTQAAETSDAEIVRSLARVEELATTDPDIRRATPTLVRIHTITQGAVVVDTRPPLAAGTSTNIIDVAYVLTRLYAPDVRDHVRAVIGRSFLQDGATTARRGAIERCACGDITCIGTCGTSPAPKVSTTISSRKTAGNTRFMHCIILSLDDASMHNNKSVKIFCNGSIHITGSTTMDEGLRIAEFVGRVLDIVMAPPRQCLSDHGDPYANPPIASRFVVKTPLKVQMINACFRISHGLRLPKLHSRFVASDDIYSLYVPDKYPAVRAYWRAPSTRPESKNGVATMLFYTGSVLITGFTRGNELLETYEFMMRRIVSDLASVRGDVRMMSAKAMAKLTTRNGGVLNRRDVVSNMLT